MMSEVDVLFWIQDNLTCSILDFLTTAVHYGLEKNIIWFVLAIVLMINKKTRKLGTVLLIAEIICTLAFSGIKIIVERPRPFINYPIELIVPEPNGYSFPSGHSTGAFAAAVTFLFFNRKIGVGLTLFAVFAAFSRMYLFVHYPTDVIAGAVLGTLSAIMAYYLVRLYYSGNGNESETQRSIE